MSSATLGKVFEYYRGFVECLRYSVKYFISVVRYSIEEKDEKKKKREK